jgi:anti-anti-sigma factor
VTWLDDGGKSTFKWGNAVKIAQQPAGESVYRITPSDRLDAVTASVLEAFLQTELQSGHSQLVLDLGEVTYLSSSGLRALLRIRRQAQAVGGDLVLAEMGPRVREIFEMIGFTDLFQVFDRVEEAQAALLQAKANRG